MRNKDIKRIFFNFLPYECAALEEYLKLMAEKGWLLQSITGTFLKFKKIKPQKIKYSVDVLHKVSIFDHKDSDVALEYREYCQAAGWTYICQKGKIQIFYTEDDIKPISIHTDEKEKFKSVFKASLRYVVSQVFIILLIILIIYKQLSELTDLALGSNLGILAIVTMFSAMIICSIEVISFFIWMIKAIGELKENKVMPYNKYKQLRIKNIFKNTYGLILFFILLKFLVLDDQGSIVFNISLLIIICIPIIILICVKILINKKKYSQRVNMAITISSTLISIYLVLMITGVLVFKSITTIGQSKVLTDKVSLTSIDFGYKDHKENAVNNPYINSDKSILAQRIHYSYGYEDIQLTYTIFISKYPWLIKFDENRLLYRTNKDNIGLKLEHTNLPSNIKVYSDREKRLFVLVSEDRVVYITNNFSGISGDEFLNTVYKKLFQ